MDIKDRGTSLHTVVIQIGAVFVLLLAGIVHTFQEPRHWWEMFSAEHPEAHVLIGTIALVFAVLLTLTIIYKPSKTYHA